MNRAGRTGLTFAAILAAGAGGYWVGQHAIVLPPFPWNREVPSLDNTASVAHADPAISGPIIYYRDPDGRPVYSAEPRRTADRRDFLAVHASEDISFDKKPEVDADAVPQANGEPKKVLYYRNPMGLPDTSPVPKKDSMGMDYIPVYAGEDGPSVEISTRKLQRTGVRTDVAVKRAIVSSVRAPGTVQLDERLVTVVATRSDAFIGKVAEVTTGDRITKGQTLLEFYSPEVAVAGAQFLTDLNISDKDNARGGGRQRLENLGIPTQDIAEIERTRRPPLSMTWRAPRSGVVLERNAVEGMKATSGEVLFRIADVSTVWIVADVPEFQLGAVAVGATATIRLRSAPGRTFSGRVALIYPRVARETRTAKVRIEMPNPDGTLLPDMYADVEIAGGSSDQVVTVLDNAVIDSGNRQIVIIDQGEGRFEPREVKIGTRGGGYTEIRNGIAAGDRVVISANFLIDAESNLKAALTSLTSGGGTP